MADADNGLPRLARESIAAWHERRRDVDPRVLADDRRLTQLAQQRDAAQRLMQVAGVGAVTATALVATVGHGTVFKNGRPFAAWRGLVPRQYATGGQPRLGHISTRGDVYGRTRLIHGARRVLPCTGTRRETKSRWAERLKQRRGNNIAAVALAAQHARILWALLARDQEYRLAA